MAVSGFVLADAVVATFDTFLSATDKEAVADVQITTEEKTAKTGARTARPRTVKKAAILNSLTSQSGQRTYERAINNFVEWYCKEQYAPTTINLHLAAVRRVAYEAADSGLLSTELAAGIRRVKGARRLGVPVKTERTGHLDLRPIMSYAER